jgi:hypothetical protein
MHARAKDGEENGRHGQQKKPANLAASFSGLLGRWFHYCGWLY